MVLNRTALGLLAAIVALLATTAMPLAQSISAEDEAATTTPAIDTASQNVLDYVPQLPDNSTTGATLAEILARPEFLSDKIEEVKGLSWFDKFINWLSRMLGQISGGSSSTLGYIAVAMLVVLVIYLLFRLLWNIFGGRRFASDKIQTATLENLSPEDLVAKANEAAAKGEYQYAIRLRFKSVLSALKMPSSTVLTNSQVLRRLKRNMPFAEKPFQEMSTVFEDTWYGRQPCSAVDYKLVSEFAGQIEQGLAGLEE